MRLSPRSYLPAPLDASLSVTAVLGRRRQQRFLWLGRQTGGNGAVKNHRAEKNTGKMEVRRGGGRICVHVMQVQRRESHMGESEPSFTPN